MNFYLDGYTLGLSVSTWSGAFLFLYLLIEILFFITTRMFLLHKLVVLPYVYYQIRKSMPKYWKIKNIMWFSLMKRKSFNKFEMFLELETILSKDSFSEIILINPLYINDEITINFFGKITEEMFTKNIKEKDLILKSEVKQFNREEKLKDLGIK